jgi:peptide/nickel transport system substrate-binding protein
VTNEIKLTERGLSLMRAGLTRRQLLRLLGVSTVAVGTAGLLAACEEDDDGEAAGAADPDGDDSDDHEQDDEDAPADDHDDDLSDDVDEDDAAEGDDEEIADADEGRSLVVGVQGLPDGLDPYLELSNVGTRVTYSLFDHLIERDFMSGDTPGAGFGLNPMLAESWERIDDLTIEFHLREDVNFHNGDHLTAEDVKFTFDRMLVDTPDDLISAAAYVGTVTEVNVIDDYTVQIVTGEPDPILENRLCSWCTWILPKDYFEEVGAEEFALNPVGTGPYRFVSLSQDIDLHLEAFEDYFMGSPAASTLEFRVIPETAGRVAAIASGEVDIITNVAPDQVASLEGTDQVTVSSIPLANCHVLVYNTFHPNMDDKRIRQAMNLAIDRELLVDALWGGRAVLMRGHQFEEYGDMFNEERSYTPYDPELAQELLEEAGYDGEEIIYYCNNDYYTNEVVAGEAIVEMWRAVGINASQQVVESLSDVTFAEMTSRTWSNSSFTADPDGAFWLRWGPETWPRMGPATWDEGESYWDATEEFDELGESMRRTLDHEERFETFQQILDIWEDEAPGTVLYIPMENYAMREDVQWQPYSFFYMDFRPHNFSLS